METKGNPKWLPLRNLHLSASCKMLTFNAKNIFSTYETFYNSLVNFHTAMQQ